MTGISDGVMTAYFHYLLVKPDYQGKGIGKKLVRDMLEHYSKCRTKVLIAYNSQIGFYERCGFRAGSESTPMFATALET
jgi:ribosomal protein S18 acetylase RimI-like enzyme